MILSVPKKFLIDFYKYLYYSILTEYILWNDTISVIVEPIFLLKIENMKIIDWIFIDESIYTKFEKQKYREIIKHVLDTSDGSDIEQVLSPISKNVFELGDNPLIYPYLRLKKYFLEILQENSEIPKLIDGVCHFHPTGVSNTTSHINNGSKN